MTSDRVNIVIQINNGFAGWAVSILNLSLHCYCMLPYTVSTLAFSGSEIYVTRCYVVLGWSSKVRCLCKFAERGLTGCVLWNHSSGLFNSGLMLLLSVSKIHFQNLSHTQMPQTMKWALFKVHSVQQKSIRVIFRMSCSGSDVQYSCHHNLSRFSFPIFVHSWRFSVFHSLQSITQRIY